MKNFIVLSFLLLIAFKSISQEKRGVIKTDIGSITEYNFYQLSYEFNIKENSSMEVGAGYGSESGINIFGLSIQSRHYLSKTTPSGFHIGPRILAIYAESKERSVFMSSKENAFGFEVDAIFGYQFLIEDLITIDPYIGGGLAIVNNQTTTGFIWGVTLGIAF